MGSACAPAAAFCIAFALLSLAAWHGAWDGVAQLLLRVPRAAGGGAEGSGEGVASDRLGALNSKWRWRDLFFWAKNRG